MVTPRARRIFFIAAVGVALICVVCVIVKLLLPAVSDGAIPSSVVGVRSALAAYYGERGRYPADFGDVEPYLRSAFRGARCTVLRTGNAEYRLTIDTARASHRFRIRYRLRDPAHVEVFDVRLE
jgi:hypothetical protein